MSAMRGPLTATHPGTIRTPVAVELADVTVGFPQRSVSVLRDVSMRLSQGEQVLVLGVSGSGKSTLLHTITGVVPHTVTADISGEVTVGGTTTTTTSVVERSRHLGVLAQDPSAAVCLPQVEQELALPLENHATDPAMIGQRITAVLTAVAATHLRHRATATLSGGESQRIGLAAALVTEPAVLLLDEPTSMLDPAGVASVRSALTEAVGRYRPTVVLVEHRLDGWGGASGTADLPQRAMVLDDGGRVLADGPTDVVLQQNARRLHAAGCWLPLDAELYALTEAPGGLESTRNAQLLRTLGSNPPPGRTSGEQLLSTKGLAVDRQTMDVNKQRRRRRNSPLTKPTSSAILSSIDMTVHAGEVVAILGANGVGKSTLLLTLAGLLEPVAGQTEGPRPGLVFQNAEHQFLATTVREEIAHGLAPDAANDIVDRQLQRHRLTHLADQNPFQLSGGEKRRLSLAAMLAHDRPVLLADEPTFGLDRRDAITTAAALGECADDGRAVVFVSHDLRLVASLANRVVVLGDGGVLADGPTQDVLRQASVLARGGLTLPPLVSWLLEHMPNGAQHVLQELDNTVAQHRHDGAVR